MLHTLQLRHSLSIKNILSSGVPALDPAIRGYVHPLLVLPPQRREHALFMLALHGVAVWLAALLGLTDPYPSLRPLTGCRGPRGTAVPLVT